MGFAALNPSYETTKHILPELLRRDLRAFGHGRHLCPHHVGIHRGLPDPGAEAAIRSGDHVLAADEPGVARDTLRDQFRMLDEVRFQFDHAGDEYLARRQRDALEQLPFVRMARIGGLE